VTTMIVREAVDPATLSSTLDVMNGAGDAVRFKFRAHTRRLHVRFEVNGTATPQQLQQIVEGSQARPAVFDVITGGVAVPVVVDPT
jgi:hypothetical protein